MNISYVNSNKTTSLPVELDALNNKDISYAKDGDAANLLI